MQEDEIRYWSERLVENNDKISDLRTKMYSSLINVTLTPSEVMDMRNYLSAERALVNGLKLDVNRDDSRILRFFKKK